MMVYERRESIPGLRMTYAPEYPRVFQARFEPLHAFPGCSRPAGLREAVV